jgi:manganese oxidase
MQTQTRERTGDGRGDEGPEPESRQPGGGSGGPPPYRTELRSVLWRSLPGILIAMGIAVLAGVAILARVEATKHKASPAAAVRTGASTVSLSLKEFALDPATLQVSAGSPVTVQVTNAGSAQHALSIDAGGKTYTTSMIDPGSTATLRLPALQAGTYQMWCPVPGHKEAGMQGSLVVGAAAAASGSGSGMANMPGMGSSSSGQSMTAIQMATMHAASTKAFPAKTQGIGDEVLTPTIVDGVKVFNLTLKQVRWEVAPGEFKTALTYNGMVPGPRIVVHQGDRVRVVVKNGIDQPTTVHFHGVTVPNAMDGVPYITQPPIMPGQTFMYHFTVVDKPGTYMYHAHFNSAEQVGGGLYGGFIIEPTHPAWDVEYDEFLNDGPLGYTMNGKGFPATAPLTATRGQTVLIRMLNVGQAVHTMHLHGYHFEIVARDGYRLRVPESIDTLSIAPGETYDAIVHATHPGVWAFHCHVLGHAEGPQGMFGMVTAFIVK